MAGDERVERAVFDSTIGEWRRYQASHPGRLRTELLGRGLLRYLPPAPAAVLDVGGGGGELAGTLARAGYIVTLLDYSVEMLALARENLQGLEVRLVQGDVLEPLPAVDQTFDVVLCHSVLEFVDRPAAVIARCVAWLAPGGLLSVAVGNALHAPLRAAIADGDLARACHDLTEPTEARDCFGLRKRLFHPADLRAMLDAAGLDVVAEHGIRTVTDLVRPEIAGDGLRYDELLELETAMLDQAPYRAMARYIQIIARRRVQGEGRNRRCQALREA